MRSAKQDTNDYWHEGAKLDLPSFRHVTGTFMPTVITYSASVTISAQVANDAVS